MIAHPHISNTYGIDLRDLRAVVAVARTGSFTAAAAELGYTQSAVSQQIAALEAELGQRLFQRRPVRSTPAGLRLAEHAGRILMRVDVARSELDRLDRAPSRLRVDVSPLAAPAVLAAALRRARKDHPALHVVVRSMAPVRAVEQVAAGSSDLALVGGISTPDNPLGFTDPGLLLSHALTEAPLVVVLPRGHPLAGRPALDLDTLVDAPWIAAPDLFTAPGPGVSRPGPAAGSGAVEFHGLDIVGLLSLVAGGHGCALLPAGAMALPDGEVAVPLGRPPLVHRTEILTLRQPLPGAADLIEALRRSVPDPG